jgi:geranylgeranyl diphosphate/geranylgeranyl-bacteriochlorophyllide a reductase
VERLAVIGGGPAAGAAALGLARAGAEVAIYAPVRRGEKPCGGALPASLLPRLAGFEPASLPAVAVAAALFENAAGGRLRLDVGGLRIFRRGDLDPALIAAAVAAGARRVAARVERVEWQGGRPVVVAGGRPAVYDWLVAADGARSLSWRSLVAGRGGGCELPGESVGLGASLDGVYHPEMVLAFPGAADAYAWIFPRPGGVSVGIAYSAHRLSHGAARGLLASFLDRHLAAPGPPPAPRYRYPIPVYGPWTLPRVATALERRVLLAGDAAALADPLTREGIRYAALSGGWAAEALAAGRPGDYRLRLGDELDAELSRAARARELFFADGVGEWMVPLCRLHRGIRTVLGDLVACRQPYRGLRRRLLRAAVMAA